jgi:hypothetical protein
VLHGSPSDGSLELVRRLVPLLALFVAAAALVGVVSRSMGGTENAHTIIEQAFSGDSAPRSGRLEAELKLSLAGVPGTPSSPITMTMDGAFQDQGKGKLPELDLDMTAGGLGRSLRLGVISTGKNMYVGFAGKHYALPDRELSQLVAQQDRKRDGAALLRSLGLDPATWTKNETVRGTTRVGGVETTHVAADVDVGRMLEDLTRVAGSAPRPAGVQAPEIPDDLVDQVSGAVKEAKLDVFVGRQDNVARRVELRVAFEAESPAGGSPVKGDFELDLNVSDVNKSVSVEAPRNARPFGELRSELDASVLSGGLSGGLGVGSAPGTSPAPPAGEEPGAAVGSDSSSGGAATSGETNAYLSCVEKAETSSKLASCAPLLDR